MYTCTCHMNMILEEYKVLEKIKEENKKLEEQGQKNKQMNGEESLNVSSGKTYKVYEVFSLCIFILD